MRKQMRINAEITHRMWNIIQHNWRNVFCVLVLFDKSSTLFTFYTIPSLIFFETHSFSCSHNKKWVRKVNGDFHEVNSAKIKHTKIFFCLLMTTSHWGVVRGEMTGGQLLFSTENSQFTRAYYTKNDPPSLLATYLAWKCIKKRFRVSCGFLSLLSFICFQNNFFMFSLHHMNITQL